MRNGKLSRINSKSAPRLGLPAASSVTHEHLVACIVAELASGESGAKASTILDAGCGRGAFLAYAQEALAGLCKNVALYGFDVDDFQVQREGFLAEAVRVLEGVAPEIPWQTRVRSIASAEPWPFGDEMFDVVVSNQVLEHVYDLDWFLSEAYRVLRPGGVSINLFPLRSAVVEGHLLLPFAHRIAGHDQRRAFISFLSRAGFGKYDATAVDLDVFAERHADYIHFMTFYRSWGELVAASKRAHLRISHRYTAGLYMRKVRRLLRRRTGDPIPRSRPLSDQFLFHMLKHVSGVTVVFEKNQTYVKAAGGGH